MWANFSKLFKLLGNVTFSRPQSGIPILIWDFNMSRIFLDLFQSESQILEVRGEKIYFPFLLKALTDLKRSKEPWTVRYSLAAIESLNPRMVITGTDNSWHFFRLKPLVQVTNVKFVAVQNARRFTVRDIFETTPDTELGADIVFVFSKAVANQYSTWLSGNARCVVIGSLKANYFLDKVLRPEPPKNLGLPEGPFIAYISEFHRAPPDPENHVVQTDLDGIPLVHTEYFAIENFALPTLSEVAQKRGLPIAVALRRDNDPEEISYFLERLNGAEIIFVTRKGWSSYEVVARSLLTVSLTSSLGYEAYSLGPQVYVASCRVENANLPCMRFGWPASSGEKGYSYQNRWSSEVFAQSVNRILGDSKVKFRTESRADASLVMDQDRANQVFLRETRELLSDSLGKESS